MCIISICSILILLSILRSLTQSYVRQHRMKTPSKELLTNVGVYASIFPKSTVTLKYGMVNASWVSTVTDSNPTVPFYCQKIQPESNLQTGTHNPHSFPLGVILRKYQTEFNMNGWKNYETWNVSLWIQNDETFYKLALMSAGFQSFMNQLHEWGCDQTQDGVKWVDADYSEVQSMFNEMKVTTDFHHWKSALVHF